MHKLRGRGERTSERGQVVILFALLLPILIGTGSIVIGIGSWYTHGKHLQTKADAGAFAGGGSWEFPCGSQIDTRIETQARTFLGPHTRADGVVHTGTTFNPQVGGVGQTQIHAVLNGGDWYDDDTPPATAVDKIDPAGSICSALVLDVKLTEDNSFPLFSLIPFFPDIKRKARVEIREIESVSGVLPIAVRAPEPVSAAAVFYNEANGDILGVKYFVKDPAVAPAGLQGWTTFNTEDPDTWADFPPAATTGVVTAISFRGACDTNLPDPNTKITTQAAPCFEDEKGTVAELCSQGGSTPIVECNYSTAGTVQSGLHFIRGYTEFDNVGGGPPELEDAWLENVGCPANGYFNATGTTTCAVRLKVRVDIGSVEIDNPPPPIPDEGVIETRTASNVEVRYCMVTPTSSNDACNSQFTPSRELQCTQSGTEVECETVGGTHPQIAPNSRGNSFAIQVRLRRTTVAGFPAACSPDQTSDFGACRFFYTASNRYDLDMPDNGNNFAPLVRQAPVQRSFRGNSVIASSIRWLRVTSNDCVGGTTYIDNEAASRPTGSASCFVMDMGLKGALAVDANEPPIIFDDGTGASQTGSVDCDPDIPQGQALIISVANGCGPDYAKHQFDRNPLCPQQNQIFAQPNPGPPWDDWPPLTCIKTRPTSNASQFRSGFNRRLFGNDNQNTCPGTSSAYVRGRNYWDKDTPNGYVPPPGGTPLGFQEGTHNTHFQAGDPRIVTIFLTTSQAFIGSGQDTFPITGFVQVYVTGYGSINGSGNLTRDDPCPGDTPPASDYACSGSDCGFVVWGHFINYTVPNPSGAPSGQMCNPGNSLTPCIATLVE